MATAIASLSENEKKWYLEVMKLYSDTAKTFTQLSVAALVLPIVFAREILAVDPKMPISVDALLIAMWVLFLVATAAGLLYQYLAVKYLVANYWPPPNEQPAWLVDNPGYVYGTMLVAFFLAACLFVVRAGMQFAGH